MVVHSNTVGQKTLSLSSANHWLTVGQGSGDCCKVVNQHSDSWCKKGFHNSIKWWVWSARKQLHRLIPWVGQPSSLDQPSLPSRNQEISHSSTVQISPWVCPSQAAIRGMDTGDYLSVQHSEPHLIQSVTNLPQAWRLTPFPCRKQSLGNAAWISSGKGHCWTRPAAGWRCIPAGSLCPTDKRGNKCGN